jgi:hypothetical protein
MKYITLIIGLLVVGCLKKEQTNQKQIVTQKAKEASEPLPEKPIKGLTLEEKVVGTYEMKEGEDTGRAVLLDNGVAESYINGKKHKEDKWSISEDGEIHLTEQDGNIIVLRINKDGSLTNIADIDKDGKREDIPKEDQVTINKVDGTTAKPVKELTLEEKKVVGTYEAKRVGDTYRVVLLENGVFKDYRNGKKREAESKWSISKDGEIHREYKDRNIVVFSINKDESITGIAFIDKEGKRKEAPKDIQLTLKKIK